MPTRQEVDSYLRDRRNWDRWGDKGSAGAMNLITDEKRLSAVKLVEKGRMVSLSRPFPVEPSIENPRPALQYLFTVDRQEGWGSAQDFYGITYHGTATTHIDALCHVWTGDGMWDGQRPEERADLHRRQVRLSRRLERGNSHARGTLGRTEASQ